MKKTLWLFLVIAICLLPACLTACGGGDVEPPVLTKPVTLTFYGITGDSTTEEAIAAVQDELNLYTEGNFSTHIVLKLYPEAEYDRVIEEKLAEAAAQQLLSEQLNEVLHTLTPREEQVLKLRFGLLDGRPRTLEEVGREFHITRERIRQIEAKALRKLRHPSRSKRLKDYLE